MTSDAKVGLLLGLFFIFVIAFLINGLPRFRSDTNSNVLTTMANSSGDTFIGSNERQVQAALRQERPVHSEKTSAGTPPQTSKEENKIRYKRPLPQQDIGAKDKQVKTNTLNKVKPSTSAPQTEPIRVNGPKPATRALPKIYVVQDGDNLAKIAKKFYGEQTGNKALSVNRIFQANRKILTSPDEIQVGQKLVIPLIKDQAKDTSSGGLLEKIKSTIGITSTPTQTPARPRPKPPAAKRTKYYTVRDGDSLWKIADKQLGDEERYREIIELNNLDDEDYLKVGQRLLIPAR
jgi:nucleoid-associated protein YgaU